MASVVIEPDTQIAAVPGAASAPAVEFVTVIERRSGWRLVDWKELVAYRDLFRFLVWRGIKVQYAQSMLGIGWAVIQPVFSMLLFTVVFGRLAKMESEGAPYALFSLAALVPWTYFANALTEGTNSLVNNVQMLSKVYFPRLVLPLSAVCSKLVDFGISLVVLAGLMAWYRWTPPAAVVWLPVPVGLMVVAAAGLGLWLTALAVQYRDVKYAINFIVQLLMYASPVVYPATLIPGGWRLVYALNPMVGVIEGFRAALLGTQPMPWDLIAVGAASAAATLVGGLLFFRSKERVFADVA